MKKIYFDIIGVEFDNENLHVSIIIVNTSNDAKIIKYLGKKFGG